MTKRLLAAAAFTCLTMAGCPEHEKADKKMSIDTVPPEVRTAIQEHAKGATIKEIEQEQEHGKTIYSVETIKDGKKMEFEVSADGKTVKDEAEDDTDDHEDKDKDHEDDDKDEHHK